MILFFVCSILAITIDAISQEAACETIETTDILEKPREEARAFAKAGQDQRADGSSAAAPVVVATASFESSSTSGSSHDSPSFLGSMLFTRNVSGPR